MKKLNAAGPEAVPLKFVAAVLWWITESDVARPPTTPIQLIAAQEVSDAVAEVAAGTPERHSQRRRARLFPLDNLGRIPLDVRPDSRGVVTDGTAGMFAAVSGDVLTTKGDACIAPTHCTDWLS
ncbi:hypothetical protein [Streptomyces sp. NBC_00893]|uniref:hypothetical protein n=1 Tax=Streptomyces sp. NBC_00893 TaxID=2975862 RepID=UPI00225ACD25|nr:hypothetical protein [Streptomyces sp. NBC_00893]MCX4851335.1 hypothetical protein [Streptomyces sp. NBC_00893]